MEDELTCKMLSSLLNQIFSYLLYFKSTLKCLSVRTPKIINFQFVSMVFVLPSKQKRDICIAFPVLLLSVVAAA